MCAAIEGVVEERRLHLDEQGTYDSIATPICLGAKMMRPASRQLSKAVSLERL